MFGLPGATLSEASSKPISLGAKVVEAAFPVAELVAAAQAIGSLDGPKSTIPRRILSGNVEGPGR